MRNCILSLLFFFQILGLFASSYHLDPINGDLNNDGSINSPWPDIQSIIEANFISSFSYTPLPYDPNVSSLIQINPDAIIQPGDTLILHSGLHGEINLSQYFNGNFITIKAAENQNPIIKYVRIKAGSHWRFEGLTISSEPYGEYLNYRHIFLESHSWRGPVKHVDILNCNIYSTEDSFEWDQEDWLTKSSTGIYVNADSILVQDCYITNVDFGISLGGNVLTALNNQIVNFAGDGMRAIGTEILVEGNLIKNCYDVDENHDDGIQSFFVEGSENRDNIIRGNTIINYEDPNQKFRGTLQGIGLFDGPYQNWIIENNVIYVNHWHGITLLGAYDCIIRNNTVVDPTPIETPGPSWIRISDHKDGTPSEGCSVVNNIVNTIHVDAMELKNLGLNGIQEYQEVFEDYENLDFRIKEGSIAVDFGDNELGSPEDILGTIRPQGNRSDIGAYEYTFKPTSVIEQEEQNFSIWPNPVVHYFNLKSLKVIGNIDTVILFDLAGRKHDVILNKSGSIAFRCDISHIASGIYFLSIPGEPFIKLFKL